MRFAAFKFIVNTSDAERVSNLHIDEEVPWNLICHFVIETANIFDTSSAVAEAEECFKCPICLLKHCNLPRITKCGHMFW